MKPKQSAVLLITFFCIALLTGCTANNEMYNAEPAGFWAGLWHGLICIVTFIISLFTDHVAIYEINNTGSWYDFGFILGAVIALGHDTVRKPIKCKKHAKSEKEKEWEEIGIRVEEKVRAGIQEWLKETEKEDSEWKEIGEKIEEKIKRELRNWAEK